MWGMRGRDVGAGYVLWTVHALVLPRRLIRLRVCKLAQSLQIHYTNCIPSLPPPTHSHTHTATHTPPHLFLQFPQIGNLGPRQVLKRQNARTRQLPVNAGHAHPGGVIVEVASEAVGVSTLGDVINLLKKDRFTLPL